jgi:flagellar hook-associated protein 2
MNITGYSSKFRIGGLATGLDTDQIVKDLMRVEKVPLDRIKQKKQLAEWRRDAYRDIINLLRGLKDEYMNVLKPSTNMLSAASYKKFTSTTTDNTVVTAVGTVNASVGTHTIKVEQLATAAVVTSSGPVTDQLVSGDVSGTLSLNGKKISVTLDGITKEITFTRDYDNEGSSLAADLQTLIENAFGLGIGGDPKVRVSYNATSKQLEFTTDAGANRLTLKSVSGSDGLDVLGISSGASNRLNTSETLESLKNKFTNDLTFDSNNQLVFTINNKTFTFKNTDTLSSMLNTINNDSEAKVNIVYDEVTDKFVITSKQLGAGENIKISQSGGTFFGGASQIATGNFSGGVDARVVLDGQPIVRNSNTFTVSGVTYTLLKANADTQTVSLNQDVDSVYDNISKFIAKYNEIIDTINNKLSEKYDRNYLPLTDEQKEAMNEDDIKKWEEKAKTGLLRNDSILQNIVYRMRSAVYDSVAGISTALFEIGITTDKYVTKGKLIIDETKLKEAIRNNPDNVMNLFSKQSTSYPTGYRTLDSSQKQTRYQEEGLVYRFFDILEDNISTLRDSNGKKGLLLEKAGIFGDASEFNNLLNKEIDTYTRKIDQLTDKLIKKEDKYYEKFAALEKAIAKMNSQANWLAAQFGQGGG